MGGRSVEVALPSSMLQRPHILDMPDEIFLHIIRYVKGWMHNPTKPRQFSTYNSNLDDIKHLRLTCQKFCDISSHFLIHFVAVSPQTSSLSRLERISQHSTIKRGVQAVRVIFSFYNSAFAEDMDRFLDYSLTKLESRLVDMEKFANSDQSVGFGAGSILEKVEEARAILVCWKKRLSSRDVPSTMEELDAWTLLRQAHDEYRRRFVDQQRLLQNGNFVRRIASAFAIMPHTSRLELYDRIRPWRGNVEFFLGKESERQTLINDLVIPFQWEEVRDRGLEPSPFLKIFSAVPSAIGKAGGRIHALEIVTSVPETFDVLVPRHSELDDLKFALGHLQYFSFDQRGFMVVGAWPPLPESEGTNLENFLAGYMEAETIKDINLNFGSLWDSLDPPTFNLGSLIQLRRWEYLSSLSWRNMPLCLTNLEQLMSQLSRKTRYVDLEYMHLLDGSWMEALDILRGQSIVYRQWSLKNVSGADYDMLSDEVRTAVFGNALGIYEKNEAEEYLMGWLDDNPLRGDPEATHDS